MRFLRAPILLFVLHIVCVFGRMALLDAALAARVTDLLGLAFLVFALGRAVFVLVAEGILAARLKKPLPRIIHDIVRALVYAGAAAVVLRAVGVDPGSL